MIVIELFIWSVISVGIICLKAFGPTYLWRKLRGEPTVVPPAYTDEEFAYWDAMDKKNMSGPSFTLDDVAAMAQNEEPF